MGCGLSTLKANDGPRDDLGSQTYDISQSSTVQKRRKSKAPKPLKTPEILVSDNTDQKIEQHKTEEGQTANEDLVARAKRDAASKTFHTREVTDLDVASSTIIQCMGTLGGGKMGMYMC
jgi:hypothetical protein